jgi:hypothetical protein
MRCKRGVDLKERNMSRRRQEIEKDLFESDNLTPCWSRKKENWTPMYITGIPKAWGLVPFLDLPQLCLHIYPVQYAYMDRY